jgi:phosphatidylethanolamine/phosphatidyl-N-methylethanolamine N-methyltransferase
MPGMGFLREFIANPITTGSITPSSRHLAQTIVEGLNLRDADTVLEYGPGTGVFTEFVLRELKPAARFAAIELNPHFAEAFKLRYPNVLLFEDSVSNVEGLCKRAGMKSVDCVVSGLPWATFPESLQVECLDAMMGVLKPGGRFATFSYLHSLALNGSRRFANRLPEYFKTVSKSPVVWRNMPPAFVYRCRR